jgi:hypothetical protein
MLVNMNTSLIKKMIKKILLFILQKQKLFFQTTIIKLRKKMKNLNLKFVLFLGIIVLFSIIAYSFYSVYSEKNTSNYKQDKKELEFKIKNLKEQVDYIQKKYESISVIKEKTKIIEIKTKYEKDSIFIRNAPVNISDSIIRAELNSRK